MTDLPLRPGGKSMKRIVIFADGTWHAPERARTTHVLRMARAVEPETQGVKQIVFYDWGLGTDRLKMTGGITGAGIDKNIMDCYRFLVHNFDPGDRLYFFGVSRGAYTVRSLAGFIRNSGLLRRPHAHKIPEAFRLYRKRTPASHPDASAAKTFRRDYAVADLVPIEFVGVWDTVGALGIPVPFWGTLGDRKFLFHDTEPSKIVQHARHAVAIDEDREDFTPVLWSEKASVDMTQLWFAGVHSDVGGGYAERGLGDSAARWMADEAGRFGLAFESHFLESLKPDPYDKLHNERKGIYLLRDRVNRRISGPVHRSVQQRWERNAHNYRRRSQSLRRLLKSVDGDWSRIPVLD